MIVPDRAQGQAHAAAEQKPVNADDKGDRQVEGQVLSEQQFADKWKFAQKRNDNRLQLDARQADEAFAHLARKAKPENRQGEAGRDLVGHQRQS
ncbi:hypothetical protein D3C87_1940100 [compost metagenome]